MESKRRGFKKSKLVMSLYKAPKPSSSVRYTSSPSAGSVAATGFYSDAFVDHLKKQKHTYITSDTGNDSYGGRLEQYNNDEGIDDKAASYITDVLRRFSQERGD